MDHMTASQYFVAGFNSGIALDPWSAMDTFYTPFEGVKDGCLACTCLGALIAQADLETEEGWCAYVYACQLCREVGSILGVGIERLAVSVKEPTRGATAALYVPDERGELRLSAIV